MPATSLSRPLFAWALYDLANTFFAVAMLSFYFPLWVVEQGAKELVFSVALTASMILVGLLMPLCGAVADATNQHMRYLRWTTLGCVAMTTLIGLTTNLWIALAWFVVANLCYQLGTIFYDALLWRLSAPQRIGRSSGFGASFGYLGSMTGLAFLWPFVRRSGYHASFIPAAGFFLLFALPSFLLIKDPAPTRPASWRRTFQQAHHRLWGTIRTAHQLPGLWRFFWASLFAVNAINTVLLFMAIYTTRVLGFTQPQMIAFFLWGQMFAVVGSLLSGQFIGRWGAKRTLQVIWTGWILALLLAGIDPGPAWIWTLSPLFGLCLGGTWSTSRVLIIELSPKVKLTELLGLAGLLSRATSMIGPLMWGIIAYDPARTRHAVFVLIGLLAISLWIFRKVPATRTASA